MNKRLLFFLLLGLFVLYKCFNGNDDREAIIESVLQNAESFIGTPYKAGGTSSDGMDCSGLVNRCFEEVDISLPRSSYGLSLKGKQILLNDVQKGDLLFFNIKRLKGSINHIGIVSQASDDIQFIHSTTSRGVLTSSMSEDYWKKHFVLAKRVLE